MKTKTVYTDKAGIRLAELGDSINVCLKPTETMEHAIEVDPSFLLDSYLTNYKHLLSEGFIKIGGNKNGN